MVFGVGLGRVGCSPLVVGCGRCTLWVGWGMSALVGVLCCSSCCVGGQVDSVVWVEGCVVIEGLGGDSMECGVEWAGFGGSWGCRGDV